MCASGLDIPDVERNGYCEEPLEIFDARVRLEAGEIDGPLCSGEPVTVRVANTPRRPVQVPDARAADVLGEVRVNVGITLGQARCDFADGQQNRQAAPLGQLVPGVAQHFERELALARLHRMHATGYLVGAATLGTMARLYHITTAQEWADARRAGAYTRSTRGQSLADVGFIHCSYAHQVHGTAEALYRDVPELRVLVIDPDRLTAEVREEAGFPHIYGALNLDAVVEVVALEEVAV